ncbi:hypothetical protein C2845_PM15G04660 [Panicum miliaceum]|uniref:F-box associated beta-propeller type 3 domain-containing protein n=1 Tax=Panicum miliaceum TaxID=4540 RepID=A0A3L6QES9_PANMI|nr:hypothetical protein C2845_PM15G04660 [Panicum miliaceum]
MRRRQAVSGGGLQQRGAEAWAHDRPPPLAVLPSSGRPPPSRPATQRSGGGMRQRPAASRGGGVRRRPDPAAVLARRPAGAASAGTAAGGVRAGTVTAALFFNVSCSSVEGANPTAARQAGASKHARRSVCRSWRAAIDGDPRLVRRHLELSRGRAPPSVLDVPCEPRLEDHWGEARSKELEFRRIRPGAAVDAQLMMLATASPANRFTAVADPVHCDGMVLVPTASGELFVCNPATRELVALPPGSPSVMRGAVAFGFDPSSNTYKAARIFYRGVELVESGNDEGGEGVLELEYDIGHEVLTLGAASSWEPTDDPPYYVAPIRPICTRGAFYWTAAVGRADEPRPTELLRFCLRDETFAVVPNPPCFFQPSEGGLIGHRDTLTELGGRLCCAHARTATGVDIWLADDDGPSTQWSMAHRIELLRPVASVLPLVADGDELLLSVDRRVLYKYSVASKAVEEVVDMQRVPDLYGARRPPLPLVSCTMLCPTWRALCRLLGETISSRNRPVLQGFIGSLICVASRGEVDRTSSNSADEHELRKKRRAS